LQHINLFDYKIAKCSQTSALEWALAALKDPNPKLLVTLNPEILLRAQNDARLDAAIKAAELIVADGVGVLWAAQVLAEPLPERIPGVELMTAILAHGDVKAFFLGAKPGIAEKAAAVAERHYGVTVSGTQHGYFKAEDVPNIIDTIAKSGAQLLLCALGESQEVFLHENRHQLNIPLMIGVGGSFDVLAGEVTRSPQWTHRLKLEWAYRILSDPKRWYRLPRLGRFVMLVVKKRYAP